MQAIQIEMNTPPAISQEMEQWTETEEIHGQEFPVCYKIYGFAYVVHVGSNRLER